MSRLLLIRHGDTELNSRERYWGHTDVKLSAAGLRQAEKLRDRLTAEKINVIYSSELQRASVTAEIIASRHQLNVITCAELREVDFGKVEGLTFDEVNQLYPEVTKMWFERNPRLQYPGGERFDEFNKRVSKFLGRLENHAAEETILIVAHNGVLRTLICYLLGLELKYRWQIRLNLASLSVVETYPQGATLTLLIDVSHLGWEV